MGYIDQIKYPLRSYVNIRVLQERNKFLTSRRIWEKEHLIVYHHTCIQQESLTNPPLIPAEPGTIQEMESLNQLRPINIDTTNNILTMKIRQNWSVSPSWRDFIFIDRSPFNSPVNMVVCYQILQEFPRWPLPKVEGVAQQSLNIDTNYSWLGSPPLHFA